MTHYFFDIKNRFTIEHDYKGRLFPSVEQALQMADLIAIDLACTRVDASGVEVQIRDPAGILLGSVPVKATDALAA